MLVKGATDIQQRYNSVIMHQITADRLRVNILLYTCWVPIKIFRSVVLIFVANLETNCMLLLSFYMTKYERNRFYLNILTAAGKECTFIIREWKIPRAIKIKKDPVFTYTSRWMHCYQSCGHIKGNHFIKRCQWIVSLFLWKTDNCSNLVVSDY